LHSSLGFDLSPGGDEFVGPYANILGNGEQIRLVRFEEGDQRREEARLAGPAAKLVCPNSGQGEEPPSAPFVSERRSKRGKGESKRVVWRL
jgi:hypothetical protein